MFFLNRLTVFMSIRRILPTLALLAVGGMASFAWAAPPAKTSAHASSGGAQVSLEQAVEQVQVQTHGRILAADTIPSGRNKLYRIKVLTPDGHVRVMQLHSNAGTSEGKPSKGNSN
ncbi:MAG: PepSY domain-containing protein [Rhodanobacteraceae bacterium]